MSMRQAGNYPFPLCSRKHGRPEIPPSPIRGEGGYISSLCLPWPEIGFSASFRLLDTRAVFEIQK
jgi:hypothetical protein